MALGRPMPRRLFDHPLPVALAEDESRCELLDGAALSAQVDALSAAASFGPAAKRGEALLMRARLRRDRGRRSGAAEDLAVACREADAACGLLSAHRTGEARLERALCALDAAALFDDEAALDAAALRLAEPELAAIPAATRLGARRLAALGRAQALRAVGARDLDAGVAAAQVLDEAVQALDGVMRRDPTVSAEAAQARRARGALLTAFALQLKEPRLAAQAADDLAQLSDRLDPDAAPLSFARVEARRAEALIALGELSGDAGALAEAAAGAQAALDALPADWSAVDRARAARALAIARQGLAEAVEEPALYEQAGEAFDTALAELDGASALPLRAACAFDRALFLARRAEHSADPRALFWAEGALKARLAAHDPAADPVAWAALQVALARLYRLRAQTVEGGAANDDGALALEAAVDVFTERGLKSLAEQALAVAR